MFIISPIKKEDATGELKLLYKIIERNLGFVPPHFELFATIDIGGMKKFMEYNQKMMTHKNIDKNLLPFLRLYIAQKECRSYCTWLNTKFLTQMNIDKNIIENIQTQIKNTPFDIRQKTLLLKVLKAIDSPSDFSKKDLDDIYALNFSDKDFFDLLRYASDFISNSKIIEAYLRKPIDR